MPGTVETDRLVHISQYFGSFVLEADFAALMMMMMMM